MGTDHIKVESEVEDLATFVRRTMERKRLSAHAVKRNSGNAISQPCVSLIINRNLTNLTVETIAALAKGLDVSPVSVFKAALRNAA